MDRGILFRRPALHQFTLPLIHEGPIDRTGAEVRHMEVRLESGNGLVDQMVIFAEHRAVAGEQPCHVTGSNSLK